MVDLEAIRPDLAEVLQRQRGVLDESRRKPWNGATKQVSAQPGKT